LSNPDPKRRPPGLFFALDVETANEALGFVRLLMTLGLWFKVGLELFVAEGPTIVRTLKSLGLTVFLDLKLMDIPETVRRAARAAARLRPDYITAHAFGGREMLEHAVLGAKEGTPEGEAPPKILGVTLLTSLKEKQLEDLRIQFVSLEAAIKHLAIVAMEAGCAGVICAPTDAAILRALLGPDAEIVCPGIRAPGEAKGDQVRVGSAAGARDDGASAVVVGRPIRDAQDPVEAARTLLRILEGA
jgi:orotidine-5'-phosphate decarboxylase